MKDNFKRIRRQATDCEIIFANDTSDKGLLLKIYKEFLKPTNKKTILKNNLKMDKRPKEITLPKKIYLWQIST